MRKRFKIPLFGMILIIAAVVTALVLLYKSHILESYVNRFLAERVASQYGLDITIAEIDGSFVEGFTLRDVSVRYKHDHDTLTLAFFPQVTINYKVANLWHRHWILDTILISRPTLHLATDSAGRWILPHFSGSGPGGGEMLAWELDRIALDSGSLTVDFGGKSYRWFDINLRSSVKSEGGTYTFKLDTLQFDANDGRLRIREGSGLATLYEDNLALQEIHLRADSTRLAFALTANWNDGHVEALVDSAHLHLQDVVSFLGSPLKGDLDLHGVLFRRGGVIGGDLLLAGMFEERQFDSLQARFNFDRGVLTLDTLSGMILNGCLIAGTGNMNLKASPQTYQLNAAVRSFDLRHLVFNSFASDLNGDLRLNGSGLRSSDMTLDMDVVLDDSHFDIYHPHQAVGHLTVTNDSLVFQPGFLISYYQNEFQFGGSLNYSGQMNLTGTADFPNLADFTHQTFIDLPGGRGRAQFALTGPTSDPGLRGTFTSDSVWLYQFYSPDFSARFDIASFTKSRQGPIEITARRGDAWSFPYDSLFARMTLDSNWLFIDTAAIANNIVGLTTRGKLDYAAYPQILHLDSVAASLTGRPFHSDSMQVIRVDSTGFIFDRIAFRSYDGLLRLTGRANYDKTLDLSWDVKNASIVPWLALLRDTLKLEGRLSSTGQMQGTLASPRFHLQANLDTLVYQSLYLGNLRAYVSYEDSTMFIDSSFLKSPEGLYAVKGELPINLALDSKHPLFDNRTQDITLTATDKEIALAPYFLKSIDYITGDFSADINLTGQPLKPHLTGVCMLKDGVIKLAELRDQLQKVDIELQMSDRLITVDKAEAEVPLPKGGHSTSISGGGTILINDFDRYTFALHLKCVNLPVNYEMGDFTGLCNADVRVHGSTPPTVTGNITLTTALYRESFEASGFSLLSALEGDKTWNLDLLVELPSKFRVQNDDIDAEFSGNLNILRTAGVYNFLGTLDVVRGNLFMLNKSFSITPGGQIIYDNIEKPDPKLNLEITTRIRTQPRLTEFTTESDYSYELALAVGGTLTNPTISGSGNSPVSNEDILPTLLNDYRPTTSADSVSRGPGLTERITVSGAGLLASQFSRLGSRSLGVETFEINPGFGKGLNPASTQLTIGTYTLPNLYVFGSSYFDVNKGQQVGLEFRLGRHYLFEGKRDETNLYHINFKMQWEY
jgi:autotransporter translocation and assembly factor TamB